MKIERHPTMKPAYARIMISIPLFIVTAVYMRVQNLLIFSFLSFMFGLWFFFKGVMRYFRNLHITYIVTDKELSICINSYTYIQMKFQWEE